MTVLYSRHHGSPSTVLDFNIFSDQIRILVAAKKEENTIFKPCAMSWTQVK